MLSDIHSRLTPRLFSEAWMEPAGRSGGDFLASVPTDRGWRILLGDVSGHGDDVAQAAHAARALTVQELRRPVTPRVFRSWNRELQPLLGGRFVCLTFLEVNPAEGRLAIANAGNPAVLVRRRQGYIDRYPGTGAILGLLSDAEWNAPRFIETRLHMEDRVVCFTDGLTERSNAHHELFGLDRVARLVAYACKSPIRLLRRSMEAFADSEPDDVTILAFQAGVRAA